MKSLVWLRNDLRMDDNPALRNACIASDEVDCIYIYSKEQIKAHNEANCKIEFIISNLKAVDEAVLSIDQDLTVCETIRHISQEFGKDCDLAFANGGDQSNETILEVPVCEELGIALIDGLGEKIQSSSWLLEKEG